MRLWALALVVTAALAAPGAHAQPLPPQKPGVRAQPLGEVPPALAPRRKPARPAAAQAVGSCEARLAALGVRYTVAAPIEEGACGAPRPLRVSAIDGVQLTPPAVVRCEVAEATARWLSQVVQPAARRSLGARAVRMRVAASYACRRRNHLSTGRLSEHGLANAIDVGGFALSNGARFAVAPAGTRRGRQVRFQRRIREGACNIFGTVLGPGADAFHDDHLHFDMRKRRRAFCR